MNTPLKTPPGPPVIKRIMLVTDFSPFAEAALGWAETLSRTFEAEMVIVHALDLTIGGLAGLPSEMAPVPIADQLIERLRAETAAEMARLAARFPAARTIIKEGSPRATLLQVATEVGADLIVTGTHGRSGLAHLLIGSVAEHIVRHSRVPVLTVRVGEPA